MAYDTLKARYDKNPVWILEIYFDRCSLTYGSAPCTATTTNAATKCFNTFATCQDRANFDRDVSKPLRFVSRKVPGLQAVGDFPVFPTLLNVNYSPTSLDPAKGLGIRESVKVSISDHPFTDSGGIDPYLSDRDYAPESQGSFWSKLIARQKFMENRRAILRIGYLDDDGTYSADNFLSRDLIVWKVTGPSEGGQVSIEMKDPLKNADPDKAQFPRASTGKLTADITDSDTTLTIGTTNIQQYKDAFDAGQKYLRIGEEVMLMDSVNVGAGTIDVTGGRATLPAAYVGASPEASAANSGDVVQVCYFFDDENITDIVETLLVGDTSGVAAFAGASAESDWIDDYSSLASSWLSGHDLTALITEPVSVQELLIELCQHNIWLWWDDRIISPNTTGKIKLDTIRTALETGETVPEINETENILNSSSGVGREEKGRISQVWLYYAIINPVKDGDELSNYAGLEIKIASDEESEDQYAKPAIKRIFSRWLPLSKSLTADTITGRLLQEYKNTKRIATYRLAPKDSDTWAGELINIKSRFLTDFYGNEVAQTFNIIEAKETWDNGSPIYEYKAISRIIDTRTGGYTVNTQDDYADSTSAERQTNAFYADDTSETIPPLNDPPYTYR